MGVCMSPAFNKVCPVYPSAIMVSFLLCGFLLLDSRERKAWELVTTACLSANTARCNPLRQDRGTTARALSKGQAHVPSAVRGSLAFYFGGIRDK